MIPWLVNSWQNSHKNLLSKEQLKERSTLEQKQTHNNKEQLNPYKPDQPIGQGPVKGKKEIKRNKKLIKKSKKE